MPTTTFTGGLSVGSGSGGGRVSKASTINGLRATFSPTSATQILLGTLPAGARVVDIVGFGGATGGTNPTVDIGTVASDAGFANELDADATASSAVAAGTAGTLIGTLLTVATPIYGKVGASAATGGTSAVLICFIVEDL
jgi:hypothetical protein